MTHPAQTLLLEYIDPRSAARILLLEGGDGWLAGELADRAPEGEVLTLDRDTRKVEAARTHLLEIPHARASDEVLPTTGDWDAILLTIPKERRFARSLLVAAWEALEPGGQLFLAGPTRGGAKAVIKDAERLFGNAVALGYRNHQRVARSIRGDSLPAPLPKEFQQPGIAPGTTHIIEVTRPEGALTLETHPGIFSWETLDEGTALLLEHLQVQPGEHVWDVGCGYGVIGLSAALAGAGSVAMSDVNLLAIGYAQRNAAHNGLANKVIVFPADGVSPSSPAPLPEKEGGWDLIVSNPAFHQGRQVNKSMADEMIVAAPGVLAPGGRLLLVANRFLNYDKFMRGHFNRVRRVAETSKFHVIEATDIGK